MFGFVVCGFCDFKKKVSIVSFLHLNCNQHVKTIPIIGTFTSKRAKEGELKQKRGRTRLVLVPVLSEHSLNAADKYWDQWSISLSF